MHRIATRQRAAAHHGVGTLPALAIWRGLCADIGHFVTAVGWSFALSVTSCLDAMQPRAIAPPQIDARAVIKSGRSFCSGTARFASRADACSALHTAIRSQRCHSTESTCGVHDRANAITEMTARRNVEAMPPVRCAYRPGIAECWMRPRRRDRRRCSACRR